jgi:hypothetical protein
MMPGMLMLKDEDAGMARTLGSWRILAEDDSTRMRILRMLRMINRDEDARDADAELTLDAIILL